MSTPEDKFVTPGEQTFVDSSDAKTEVTITSEELARVEAAKRFKELGFDKIVTEPPLQPGNQLAAMHALVAKVHKQAEELCGIPKENTCGPKMVTPSGVPLNAGEEWLEGVLAEPEPPSKFEFHERAKLGDEIDSHTERNQALSDSYTENMAKPLPREGAPQYTMRIQMNIAMDRPITVDDIWRLFSGISRKDCVCLMDNRPSASITLESTVKTRIGKA